MVSLQVYSIPEEQTHNAPPVPGLPENTDPTEPTPLSTIKTKPGEDLLSNSYLPAVMQAIAYYVELIQYEPQYMTTIEPPYTAAVVGQPVQSEEFTSTVSTTQRTTQRTTYSTSTRPTTRPTWYTSTTPLTTRPTWYSTTTRPTTTRATTTRATTTRTTTTRPITTRPTYQTTRPTYQTTRPTYQTTRPTLQTTKQTTTTIRTTPSPWYADQSTHAHNPGYYQPSSPLYDYPESVHRPTQKPQTGNLPLLSISQSQFFDWFLQMKTKQLSEMSGKLNTIFKLLANSVVSLVCFHAVLKKLKNIERLQSKFRYRCPDLLRIYSLPSIRLIHEHI